jgi:hypothetical protein
MHTSTQRWGVALAGFLVAALTSEPFAPVWQNLEVSMEVLRISFFGGSLVVAAALLSAIPFRALVPESSFECRAVSRDEIKSLLHFSSHLLPGSVMPLRDVKTIHQVNPSALFIGERTWRLWGLEITRKVGCFSLLPLTREASELLAKEALDGLSLTPLHICKPNRKPAALYLGSIAAKGFRNKADIILYVKGRLSDEVDRGVRVIYTRPISKDGLRLAHRHRFMPVADGVADDQLGRIYRKNF